MGHKRKRQSDTTDENVAKIQLVEDASSGKPSPLKKEEKKAKSTRKQLRSERKAKRSAVASENANKKKLVAAEKLVAASAARKDDAIAGGEDFVPLTTEGALELLKNEKRQQKQEKKQQQQKKLHPYKNAQRASPRSIRKAAQAAKALSLTTEEYGPESSKNAGDAAVSGTHGPNSSSQTKARFICFVGNLPYTATTEQVQAHFRKLNPKSIRHSTDKESGQSKGFAFLEFHDYDRMKTCIKLYHHSIFEPQRTAEEQRKAGEFAADLLPRIGDKKNKGRMLNVQLTVGGGGKSSDRRKKIAEKNVKLEKQRAKARVKAIKQGQKDARNAKKLANGETKPDTKNAPNGVPVDLDVRGDIHPSRLNRVIG